MTEAQINNELITLANFFGSVASTPHIDEAIIRKANMQLARCIDALDKGVNKLIGASSGIVL